MRLLLITALCLIAIPAPAQTALAEKTTAQSSVATAVRAESFRDCGDCPEMIVIPSGSFDMGNLPTHRVTIEKTFAIGKTEVTQGQWRAIMCDNPSHFTGCGANCPVEQVSWNEAQAFIKTLNAKTGKKYRLPSEAEWEYACRAKGQQAYCGGDNADSVAWYGAYMNPAGSSGKTTNPVAAKQANAFGLYDMSGNVWEWVEDSFHENFDGAPTDGSAWQGNSAAHVLRGGSWNFEPQFARATFRIEGGSEFRSSSFGFRVARTVP